NMDLLSSFLFRQVYENGLNTITSPLQQSVAFASRNRPDASINFLYDRNGVFLSDQPTDQPTVVLRKFPTFEASLPERTLGGFPLYFDADASISGIARRDPSITTPSFVERLDLHPSFELPVLRSTAFDWSQ